MKLRNWSPTAILNLIDSYEEQVASDPQGLSLRRNLEMWKRLASRPEMKDVWTKLNFGDGGFLSPIGIFCTTLTHALDDYDRSKKLTKREYEKALKNISKLAMSLSGMLNLFESMSDTNNPFLLRWLLNDDDLTLLKDDARLKIEHGTELNASCGRHFPDEYSRADFPTLKILLERASNLAKIEADAKNFRLQLPTKVHEESARRTYFIRQVGSLMHGLGAKYSQTIISTFCAVALDDHDITPDLVGALCPSPSITRHPPWTPAEILAVAQQRDDLLRMVNEICLSANLVKSV